MAFVQAEVLVLVGRSAQGDDKASLGRQLLEEGGWYIGRGGGDKDDVVWRVCGPTVAAVGDSHLDVGVAQPFQRLGCVLGQSRLELERDQVPHQPAQYGRLVAGAGAD